MALRLPKLHVFMRWFLLSLAIAGSAGLNPEKNRFVNPGRGGPTPVWLVGEEQVISWKTEMEVYNISLWHEFPGGGGATFGSVLYSASSSAMPMNFTWTVQLYDFDLSFSNVFFFWFNRGAREHFISRYFNITRDDSILSTRSTATTMSTATTSVPSSLPSSPDASATATTPIETADATPSSEPQSDGLTTNSKVGLGVGVGIGVPIIALLAFIAFSKYFRRRPQPTDSNFQQTSPMVYTSNTRRLGPKKYLNDYRKPVELDAGTDHPLQPELPSDSKLKRSEPVVES
ncbi:predicted protein [Uncinocarpus reesii 1704]|uniref:Mid2 domain-containing protein n=1 Tax=Uncinocarpus reesii (strain UAMH 1704) TaxID=336963 RepID=C4JRM0_UNCRE|nr:uncharacterized protein UREG_05109 [Uncinocarpus reesii 1704]EEP80267.1 predicted protein [Uncinocarpus reesii 1704]